jgi:O-antigen/teichoic acid export membrane protein
MAVTNNSDKFGIFGLLRSSGIYTLSSLINASVPFFLIPFLTDHLSPAEYGLVSMSTILINILSPIIGFSSHGAIQRRYFDTEAGEFKKYVGNAFHLLLFSFILTFALIFLFNSFLSGITEVPSAWHYVILLIAVNQFCSLILLTIWQSQLKPINYGLMQITQSILNFGLTLLLIESFDQGWEGRIIAQFLASLCLAFFAVIYLVRNNLLFFRFDKNDLKDILKFSMPLIPHTLGGLMIAFTDRLFITNVVNIKETGVYTLAYQIGSILGLLTFSFNTAYIPWLYKKLTEANFEIKKKIVRFTYVYFAILIFIAFAFVSILPWLIELLAGKSYQGAVNYTIWIVLGNVFNGMYLMVSAFLFYAKKTSVLSRITFFSALINIPLCYILLIHYGTIGAAFSMSVVFFISFILTWYYSNKNYSMPWFSFKGDS